MYFNTKNYLKNNHNNTTKQALNEFPCHAQELLHFWKDREGPNTELNKMPSMIFILSMEF